MSGTHTENPLTRNRTASRNPSRQATPASAAPSPQPPRPLLPPVTDLEPLSSKDKERDPEDEAKSRRFLEDMEKLRKERLAEKVELLQEADGMRIMGEAIGNLVGQELQDILNPMVSSIGNQAPGYSSISSHPLKLLAPELFDSLPTVLSLVEAEVHQVEVQEEEAVPDLQAHQVEEVARDDRSLPPLLKEDPT